MRKADQERALQQLQRDIATITDLYQRATTNLQQWAGRGYPTRSSGTGDGSRGGDGNDPVMRTVIGGVRDSHQIDLDDADRRLRRAHADVAWLARFATRYATIIRPEPEQRECAACGRYVSGTARDRLRRGMCEPCYRENLRTTTTNSTSSRPREEQQQHEPVRRRA